MSNTSKENLAHRAALMMGSEAAVNHTAHSWKFNRWDIAPREQGDVGIFSFECSFNSVKQGVELDRDRLGEVK